jgi:hypothetical protein
MMITTSSVIGRNRMLRIINLLKSSGLLSFVAKILLHQRKMDLNLRFFASFLNGKLIRPHFSEAVIETIIEQLTNILEIEE